MSSVDDKAAVCLQSAKLL